MGRSIASPCQHQKVFALNPPEIPYISNVTGTWITVEQATDPNYWATHLRQPVRLAEGLQHLGRDRSVILLEVGPGRTLRTLAKRHPDIADEQIVLSSIRHPQEERSDIDFILNTLGQLWLAGVRVDWEVFYKNQQRYRIPLPTYPFERQRYWITEPLRSEVSSPTLGENAATGGALKHKVSPQPSILNKKPDMA